MTPRDSGHDFDPKHRIIGAIVVVALAVIFIPMVLGERAVEPPATTAEPPAADTASTAGNKLAITRVGSPERRAAASPAVSAAPPAAAPAREPAPAPPPKTGADMPNKATAAVKPPASGWVVQVGTFSNAANADRLGRKLRAGGQAVLAERVDLQSGRAVRLRVGPFPDRAAALKARERIRKDVGVQGVVLAYP